MEGINYRSGYRNEGIIMIKTENVTKYFNKGNPDEVIAVNDVSIEIKGGDFAVLKGPSGSGKTTLLSMIGCMSRPTSGKVIIGGRDVSHLPERFMTRIRRNTFGFVFQQFHLIRGVTVCDNVMLPLYPTGIKLSRLRGKAEEILYNLGIEDRKDFPVQKLSGGEQQRTAIGRALINDPDVILADEPTAHLDTHLSGEFLSIMRNLQQQGKTVIIATHDPLVYENEHVNLIIEMRDGRIKNINIQN